MAGYIVIVRSDYVIGTIGPGHIFQNRQSAEKALLDDMDWVAGAYDCDEPKNEEDLVNLINEYGIEVDWVIEKLSTTSVEG
jgi:hypothetical protein